MSASPLPDDGPVVLRHPACPSGPQSDGATVAEIIAAYLDDLAVRRKLGHLTTGSVDRAAHYLGSFADTYGRQPLSRCSPSDLTHWLADNPRWKSDHTRNDALGAVVSCFRFAEDERLIERTPYRRPKGLRLRLRPRRPATRAEVAAIMRAAMFRSGRRKCPGGRAFRRAVLFLRRSGARPCEMRSATFDQVDWQACVIRLSRHKTDATSGEDRLIACDPAVMRLLRILFARLSRGRIFRNSRNACWTKDSFSRAFRCFARRAGITSGVSGYSLRHGFACEAVERGVSDRAAADLLGHRSTKMLSWYASQTRQRADHLQCTVNKVTGRPPRDR